MNVPDDLKYTKSHEWVRLENGVATVGITDYAQSELGDIVFVETPAVGKVLTENEPVGTIESVKTVSDVYAPIAGEVVAVNTDLSAHSEKVNEDPYGAGWILRVKVEEGSNPSGLMDAGAYLKVIES